VAAYPAEPRFQPDYRVLLDVREFEGPREGPVRLRVRWTIASAADGRAAVVEESLVEQPVPSASWEDRVAAHSAALGVVSREIATALAGLPEP
jgi:uncharacterized lipoprotein YmbA